MDYLRLILAMEAVLSSEKSVSFYQTNFRHKIVLQIEDGDGKDLRNVSNATSLCMVPWQGMHLY
jgi:hypothetical protein